MTGYLIGSLLLAVMFAVLWRRASHRGRLLEDELARQKRDDMLVMQFAQRRGEMLHRLVDGIDDGLLIINRDQTVMFSSRGASKFFPGTSEMTGRPFADCVKDQRIAELVSSSAKLGRRLSEELLVTIPHEGEMGGERIHHVEAVPLSQNEPAGLDGAVLVILRDETQKHQLEKIRKDFVANASHELRTPLSIIIGYLENLQDGDITDQEEMQRAFQLMKKHGDRLASIVEDLLVISRMESGQADSLRMESFDFGMCVQEVVQRLTPMGAQAKVKFEMDMDDDPMILGDRFYWDQILFNLVSNAIKENLSLEDVLKVGIRLRHEKEESVIEVSDNGLGIPSADLPFVFKRFYRVSRPRPGEVKGTGLGLSIVKRAVEAHRGTITVSSKPGIQTLFTIRVPRNSVPAHPQALNGA